MRNGGTAHADGLLGRFLREHRAKITLAAAGLPPRRGSRTGTLTQEDLARLTGFSVRTISALEQGIGHKATPELLDALTAALRLGPDERQTLWYLAADVPAPVPEQNDADLSPGLRRLLDAVYPHIAYACDALRNVKAINNAAKMWGYDFDNVPAEQRNVGRWLFLNPHARHVFPNWEDEAARSLLGALRIMRARMPRNRQLGMLIEELCDRSPDARRLWDSDVEIRTHPPDYVTFRLPGHTDPWQPDDESWYVRTTVAMLNPTRTDDDHLFVAFLLPGENGRPIQVSSAEACAACARGDQLAATAPGPLRAASGWFIDAGKRPGSVTPTAPDSYVTALRQKLPGT